MAPHGGEVFKQAAAAGLSPNQIVDYSANINPLGLPRGVKAAMKRALSELSHYPEIDGAGLSNRLAGRHGLVCENVMVGNGSTALIYLLVRALKCQHALLWGPTFTEYERALRQHQSRVEYLSFWENGRMRSCDDLADATLRIKPDLVFICNPNNPTGCLINPGQLLPMIKSWSKAGITCVLDEAFIDFAGDDFSLASAVNDLPNLVILRSLTKIYALAGIRCGYLLTSECLYRQLAPYQEPWSMNSIALAAADRALQDNSNFLERSRKLVRHERDFLVSGFNECKGLKVFPSQANYLLTRLPEGADSQELSRQLFAKARILIRICDDYFGLDNRYVRFAVRGRQDNLILLRTMKELW